MNVSGAANLHAVPTPEAENSADRELPVEWAVVLFRTHQGVVIAADDPNLLADHVKPSRRPSMDDIDGAAGVVRNDILSQKMVAQLEQKMMSAAQQAQNNALLQQVMSDPRRV